MSDVVAGHGEDGDLGHRALAALDDAGALVQRRQIGVEVAGVALTAGDLALGGGELTQSLAIAGHIGEDDQDVLAQVKGQILGDGQRRTGGDDTLDDGVVGQVQQHDHAVHDVGGLKALFEVVGNVVLHAHGGEHDGEILAVGNVRLFDDLHRQLVVLHAGAGEDGQLLAADKGGQRVDGRNAGADVVTGIDAAHRVDGRAVHVAPELGVNFTQAVNGAAQAVQGAAQDLGAQVHHHGVAGQGGAGVVQREAGGAFKHLDDALLTLDHNDTAHALGAVGELHHHHLVVGSVLHAVQDYQRAVDLA